jgi:dephospho-CoA kinase/SAM-dependent methyltransferase
MERVIKSGGQYLDSISGSASEKAELVTYVEQLKNGRILEIGPGAGTALAEIVRCVETAFSPEERPEIIVFDVIADVLDRVKETVGETDVALKYVVGDGAKDLPFEDGAINAVNLSAVAHECFSYGGGFSGIHRLAKECGRVMAPRGILTYRDPDGIELHSMEEARLTQPLARRFLAYFLPKFLDRTHTHLKDKVDLGYSETLELQLNEQPLSIEELINLSPEALEDGELTLKAKAGLIHEIQRHLVLFAKDVGGMKMEKEEDEKTSVDPLNRIEAFTINNPEAIAEIAAFLEAEGVSYTEQSGRFQLTISALNLHHTKIGEIAAQHEDHLTLSSETIQILNWGSREGEENYFYGSCEEVIARFAHFSLIKDGNGEMGYSCLCPISTDHIRTVERGKHSKFLKAQLKRTSEDALSDRKRHIHFAKLPLEQAFPVLLNYYRETHHPALLETLQALMFIMREFTGTQADFEDLMGQPWQGVQGCVDLCSTLTSREEVSHGVVAVRSILSSPHLGLIGGIASGKTTIGNILNQHGYTVISFSDFIRDELVSRGVDNPTRNNYFEMANAMRKTHSRDILARLAIQKVVGEGIDRFVFDGMRNPDEIDFLKRFIRDFILIGVETATEERIRRVQVRLRDIDPTDRAKILGDIDREFFDPSPDGCRLSQVMSLSDVFVNGSLTPEENNIFIERLKLPYPSTI